MASWFIRTKREKLDWDAVYNPKFMLFKGLLSSPTTLNIEGYNSD